MPMIRTTIASNVNRTKKAPLLISIPESLNDNHSRYGHCLSLVRQEAKKKLHLKQALTVFTTDGRKIDGEQAWEAVLKNDVVLVVAGHEDYVGARTYKEPAERRNNELLIDANSDCPVEILARQAEVDSGSVVQLETTARTLSGMVHATGQPDLHPGTKFPIGAVFVSKDWIHPPLIGGDIGCGMAWYKTTLSRSKVEDRKGQKIADKLRGLEGPWRTPDCRKIWLEQERQLGDDGFNSNSPCAAGEEWDISIGTIGAGNHFAELQVVEQAATVEDGEASLREGDVLLLVHSGSRGYGAEILKRHTSDGRTSIHASDPRSTGYLLDHNRACLWASRNRDLIALRFLSLLEPGMPIWDRAMHETDGHVDATSIHDAQSELQARKVVDIIHNALAKTNWPPNETAESQTQHHYYIHRKGAAPTTTTTTSVSHSNTTNPPTPKVLSILPLPGSRAAATLILHPTTSTTNDFGRKNALSVAHGAGRALSRAKAAAYVSEKYAGRADDLLRGDCRSQYYGPLGQQGSGLRGEDRSAAVKKGGGGGGGGGGGTWVVCEDKQLVWEEAGEAYKDVWAVGEDLMQAGCAEVVGWCRPVVSYKARKE